MGPWGGWAAAIPASDHHHVGEDAATMAAWQGSTLWVMWGCYGLGQKMGGQNMPTCPNVRKSNPTRNHHKPSPKEVSSWVYHVTSYIFWSLISAFCGINMYQQLFVSIRHWWSPVAGKKEIELLGRMSCVTQGVPERFRHVSNVFPSCCLANFVGLKPTRSRVFRGLSSWFDPHWS